MHIDVVAEALTGVKKESVPRYIISARAEIDLKIGMITSIITMQPGFDSAQQPILLRLLVAG